MNFNLIPSNTLFKLSYIDLLHEFELFGQEKLGLNWIERLFIHKLYENAPDYICTIKLDQDIVGVFTVYFKASVFIIDNILLNTKTEKDFTEKLEKVHSHLVKVFTPYLLRYHFGELHFYYIINIGNFDFNMEQSKLSNISDNQVFQEEKNLHQKQNCITLKSIIRRNTNTVRPPINEGEHTQMENQNSINIARTTLLKGLRFHKDSIKIYREYFMLEMEFLKKLVEKPELAEEFEDGKTEILEGKIVQTVFLEAIENVNEPIFAAELLGLALKSGIPKLFDNLKTALLEKYGDQSWSWLILINLELYPKPNEDRTTSQKMSNFSTEVQKGLDSMKTQDFLAEILKLLQEISENHTHLQNFCEETVFQVLNTGKNLDILTEEQTQVCSNLE